MPIPRECAKPDWIDGRDIRLSDDQVWTFPLPRVTFRLTADGLERKHHDGCETNLRYGPRFFDLQEKLGEYIDATANVADGEPGGFNLIAYYKLLKPVAADLLVRNYDVTPDQIDDLLCYTPGCEVNRAMWLQINEVARGIGGRSEAVAEVG